MMENFEKYKAMYKKQKIHPKVSGMGAAILFIEQLSIPKTFGTLNLHVSGIFNSLNYKLKF
jgi:hypothetical protein